MTRSVSTFCLLVALAICPEPGLTVQPAAGESAAIPVTAEVVYPLGVVAVDLADQKPSVLTGGIQQKPSERHLELLLYPGKVGESRLQLGPAGRSSTVVLRSGVTTVKAVIDTITVPGDSLTVVTIIPVSQ